jgi:Fic family protein
VYKRFLNGDDVGQPGRKRLLRIDELETVQKTITERAQNLDALDTYDVRELLQNTILQKKEMNHLADKETFAPISRKTVQRYIINDLPLLK